MANNRMWLECRGCGKQFLLAKHFGEQYNTYYDDLSIRLDKFMAEHAMCGDVHYENQFKLTYDFAYDEDGEVIKED